MIYIARSQGDRIFKLGGIAGDRYSWPWHGTKDDLQAWKDGRTGEELVDAGMKELLLTGYMSMRARHIVASYLIYELGVDWRHGAAHFEEHLLDYDPALNWVMWMLQTGVMGPKSGRSLGLAHFDAKRPYASQRRQLSNHAPDRAYIRHWLVDDLRNVAASTSSHHGRQQKRLTCGGSESRQIRDDRDEGREAAAKHQPEKDQFGDMGRKGRGKAKERVGKGRGKHRHCEVGDACLADGPKKRRWGRQSEGTSYSELTLSGA